MFNFLENTYLDSFADWLRVFVIHQSVLAPFLLLFIEEAGVPLPIPGDVYVAFEGYRVAQGKTPYWLAFGGLLCAVLLGSSVLYFISARWGNVLLLKIGKYMHLNQKRVVMIEKEFKKYGAWVIIIGRHIPGFRVPITFFAGTAGVPYPTFIAATFVSVIFWIAFYLGVGSKLGRGVFRLLHNNHMYTLLLILPVLIFAAIVVYFRLQSNRKNQAKTVL